MLSAFWHGFYPCFYILFITAHFLQEIQKMAFKNKEKLAALPTIPCQIITQIFYCLIFNFCGLSIQNARHDKTWMALKNAWFLPLWAIAVYKIFPHFIKFVGKNFGPKQKIVLEEDLEIERLLAENKKNK